MSWQKVKLKEVLKQYRVQHIVQDDIEYRQVTISKYDGVTYRGTKIGKDIGRKRQFVIDLKKYPNTLMLVRQGVQEGSIGIAPAEVDGCIATENMPMFSVEGIDLEYLRFLLKSPYFFDELNKIETTGSAQKSIHERQILEIEIPLPSLEEQKQFVNELTKLKNGGLEISSELTHQLDLIKQLRQAFLREAMQGKLITNDKLRITNGETGHDLLAKIKTEKAQLIAEKKLKKEKELPPITEDEIPFDIPEHWTWCRLGEISSIVRGGSPRPAGDPKYYDGDIPFLKVGDLTGYEGKYCNTYTHTIKKEGLYKTRYVEANTLMLTNSGATLGVPRICTFPTTFNDGIAAFLGIDNLNKEFLFYFLREKSDYFLKEASRGQGQPNLNTDIIGSTLIPLPPLHEQEQIVAKLEELMAFCDGLEQSIKESQGYNEKLLQQVLREALKPH